jgi:hypothetical protein
VARPAQDTPELRRSAGPWPPAAPSCFCAVRTAEPAESGKCNGAFQQLPISSGGHGRALIDLDGVRLLLLLSFSVHSHGRSIARLVPRRSPFSPIVSPRLSETTPTKGLDDGQLIAMFILFSSTAHSKSRQLAGGARHQEFLRNTLQHVCLPASTLDIFSE